MDIVMSFLGEYRLLTIFVGSFFFGDGVIITAAYLAGQLHWNVVTIFLIALAGTSLSDVAWFVAGKVMTKHGSRITVLEKQRGQIMRLMEKMTGNKLEHALIYVKFLYGGRIAMILYAASQGMSYARFTLFNTTGILLWFIIFFPLGYFAGRGVARAMPFMGALEAGLLVFVGSVVAIRLFYIWFTSRLQNK